MSAQHTPGPWTHTATAGNHDFAVYPEATGRDVALVRDFNEANARLIAAAPEMLEALRALLYAYEPVEPTENSEEATALALAAIAKAEGRAE